MVFVMPEAYITQISAALGGHQQSLQQAASEGLLLSDSEALAKAGFVKHHISPEEDSYELARRSVLGLHFAPESIDAIVYSTCIPANATIGEAVINAEQRDVKVLMDFPASHLQADFNMQQAQVMGINQMACTGVNAGIRTARMLMNDDPQIRNVLCVTADRFPQHAHYEQAYNLISDGALACLVSTQAGGYRIVAAHGITNGAMATADDEQTIGSFFSYSHRVIHECLQRAGIGLDELDWIVPQNTHRNAWRILAGLLPFAEEKIQFPTLAEVGHLISGDNLLNLQQLEHKHSIRPGEKVLLFSAGYGLNWHCLLLEKE